MEIMLYPGSFSWDAAQRVPTGQAFRRAYGDGWVPFCPTVASELLAVSNLVKQAALAGVVRDGTQISLGLWQLVTATTNAASGSVRFNEPSGGWVAICPADIETSPLQRNPASPYFTSATPFDTNNGDRSRDWRLPPAWGPGLLELSNLAVDSVWPGTANKLPSLISNITALAIQQPGHDEDFGALYVANGKRGDLRGNDCKASTVCAGGVLLARVKPAIAAELPPWPTVSVNGRRRPLNDGESLPRIVNGQPTVISWTWKGTLGYLALWDNQGTVYADGQKATPSIDLRTLPSGRTFQAAIRNVTPAPDRFERFSFVIP